MQFTWNIAQGVSSYNKQTGFGFVIGAVYNANAALRIPETNSSFLPQWWYAGTAICDVTCTEYGVQATATDAVRAEDLECRSLPVWFRVDVPAEGVYRTKITVTGTDGGEVLVFIGRRRLVWRGTLAAGENKTITAYCDVFPIVPRGQVDAVPSTAVNVTVVGGALAAAAVAEAPDVRRIWVCGDSTVTDQTANLPYAPGTSYCGWGQMLPAYLPDVCITNHAHSGLTTESFTSEGHWDIVKPRLRAGDICLYQFGHNDQKLAHLQAYGGYTDRLRTYIKEARTAGAVPVLVTPLARNSWKDAAHYNDFLADFADAVLTLGKAENVMVLDLHTWAMALMQQDGLETAKRWFYPGDYTHTNDFGAYKMAGFVAHALGDALGLMVTDAPEWTPTPQSYCTAPGYDVWEHYWVHLDGVGVKTLADSVQSQGRLTAAHVSLVAGLFEMGARLAFASLLAPHLGVWGIWLATPLSWASGCIIPVVRYYSKEWMKRTLI